MCNWKKVEQLLFIDFKPPRHVENVIMMVNNAGDVLKLCISTKNASFTVDVRIIFDINDI